MSSRRAPGAHRSARATPSVRREPTQPARLGAPQCPGETAHAKPTVDDDGHRADDPTCVGGGDEVHGSGATRRNPVPRYDPRVAEPCGVAAPGRQGRRTRASSATDGDCSRIVCLAGDQPCPRTAGPSASEATAGERFGSSTRPIHVRRARRHPRPRRRDGRRGGAARPAADGGADRQRTRAGRPGHAHPGEQTVTSSSASRAATPARAAKDGGLGARRDVGDEVGDRMPVAALPVRRR